MSRIVYSDRPREGTNSPNYQRRNELETVEVESITPGVKVAANVARFQATSIADLAGRELQGALKIHVGEEWGHPLQPTGLTDDELASVLAVLRQQKLDMEQTRTAGLAEARTEHAQRTRDISAALSQTLESLRQVRELAQHEETQLYLGQLADRLQNELARETLPFNVRTYADYYPTPWRSLTLALQALESEQEHRAHVAARERAKLQAMLREAGISF